MVGGKPQKLVGGGLSKLVGVGRLVPQTGDMGGSPQNRWELGG